MRGGEAVYLKVQKEKIRSAREPRPRPAGEVRPFVEGAMAEKRKITISVDEDIFVEVLTQIRNFIDDFYGAEKEKIEVSEGDQ